MMNKTQWAGISYSCESEVSRLTFLIKCRASGNAKTDQVSWIIDTFSHRYSVFCMKSLNFYGGHFDRFIPSKWLYEFSLIFVKKTFWHRLIHLHRQPLEPYSISLSLLNIYLPRSKVFLKVRTQADEDVDIYACSSMYLHQWYTRNTLTQASKNGRKPYLFPQNKFVSVFYVINIFNTIYYFKPTNFNCAERKFNTFFGFVYQVSCLPWFETKNKIRCIDAPKYEFTHRNLPNLKNISELFKMYMKSLDSFI